MLMNYVDVKNGMNREERYSECNNSGGKALSNLPDHSHSDPKISDDSDSKAPPNLMQMF